MDESKEALLGRFGVASAALATVWGPLHALARFATEDGKEDLASGAVRAWAEPAADTLRPLLDWGSADTVYTTYGKLWFPLFLVATLSAFAVRARRGEVHGAEKWGWRVALVGYVLATASTFGDYWTPWLDQSFLFLGIPGVLLSVFGSLPLGIGLLRRGFRPKVTAWLLALWLPLFFVLSDLIAMGAAALPFLWAWALAARAHLAAAPEQRVHPVLAQGV